FAWAQAYPTRPVRIIVPYPPGGAPDIVARLMGQWLSERFGQPFIIENRPGAGGNIGTETALRAPPDGHTLLYVVTANAISATFVDSLNFNFTRDVAPVTGSARAGGNHGSALAGATRHPDRGRFCAGLRGKFVAWRRRAQEYTGSNRRQAERGDQCSPRRSQD